MKKILTALFMSAFLAAPAVHAGKGDKHWKHWEKHQEKEHKHWEKRMKHARKHGYHPEPVVVNHYQPAPVVVHEQVVVHQHHHVQHVQHVQHVPVAQPVFYPAAPELNVTFRLPLN